MSDVLIPLGGAGGKNRGSQYKIPENAQTVEMFGSVFFPLPPGVYKKYVLPNGQPALPSADGGDAVISMSKEFLKKQAIKTFGIASITNFSLSMYAHKQVRLTWAKPTRGLWSGTRFVFKYDSMPTSVTDGFYTLDSADVHYETGRLEERQLYVRAYSYVTTNEGRWYDEGKVSATIRVSGISGSVTFGAGAGTWTVPEGVRRIRYILVGHGGNGVSYSNGTTSNGGGGGGGGYFTTGYMDVTPGQSLPWAVPTAQGQATVLNGATANSGEQPRYSLVYNAPSDDMLYRTYCRGGNGGSGGGGGVDGKVLNSNINKEAYPGKGGANGLKGYGAVNLKHPYVAMDGGDGQGTSTTGFNGVLYCGGGGGALRLTGGIRPGMASKYTKFSERQLEPIYENGYYYYDTAGHGGEGGGGYGQGVLVGGVITRSPANGIDGLGGGGGGGYKYYRDHPSVETAGRGGTGCIYIAWGSSMNDGS